MQEMNKEEQQDNDSNYNAGGGCLGVGIFNILVFETYLTYLIFGVWLL